MTKIQFFYNLHFTVRNLYSPITYLKKNYLVAKAQFISLKKQSHIHHLLKQRTIAQTKNYN